jgi:hypothetical protein
MFLIGLDMTYHGLSMHTGRFDGLSFSPFTMASRQKNMILKEALSPYTCDVAPLTKIMNEPFGSHAAIKVASICVGHAHCLFAVLNAPKKKKASDEVHLIVPQKGQAFHTIFYHMSGGVLRPPPVGPKEREESHFIFKNWRERWLPPSLAARNALAQRAADGDGDAERELADFLAAPFDLGKLRPRDAAFSAKTAALTVRGGTKLDPVLSQPVTAELGPRQRSTVDWSDAAPARDSGRRRAEAPRRKRERPPTRDIYGEDYDQDAWNAASMSTPQGRAFEKLRLARNNGGTAIRDYLHAARELHNDAEYKRMAEREYERIMYEGY